MTGFAETELSVVLPAQEFDALWERLIGPPLSIEIGGKLNGVSDASPVELKGDVPEAVTEVRQLTIQIREGEATPQSWFADRTLEDIRHALAGEHLEKAESSQIYLIAFELAQSIARNSPDAESMRCAIARAKRLISASRPVFRGDLLLSETRWGAWSYSPKEFEEAIADKDEKAASKLRRQYDELWQHYSVTTVVMQGEEKNGATSDGFRPDAERLEDLASMLVEDPGISSPTLEWALVDALIYAECVAFAQHTLSGHGFLGMAVPGKLKGLATPGVAGRQLLKTVGSGVGEAVKIAGTYFVASFLAGDNAQTAWIITTGVTAARWIRAALPMKNRDRDARSLELFTKMAGVHDVLKTPQFNGRSLRDQLDRVTADGAVFSPWLFNLLDARIRREGG